VGLPRYPGCVAVPRFVVYIIRSVAASVVAVVISARVDFSLFVPLSLSQLPFKLLNEVNECENRIFKPTKEMTL
jgi:hypothetical protein